MSAAHAQESIDRLLTKDELADYLRVHPATIDAWSRQGVLPRPIKVTPRGHSRWPERVIRAWENEKLANVGAPVPSRASA